MDAAGQQWTDASIEKLEKDCKLERGTVADMKVGLSQILFSPTHAKRRSAGGLADGTAMDSGSIHRFKMKMRKRCAEYGGKRGVWDKPTMLKLLNEVWASMPIEEFHPDLVWVAKNYPKIKTAGGKWVGWGKKSKVAHGLGS